MAARNSGGSEVIWVGMMSLLFGSLYLAVVLLMHWGFTPLHQVIRLATEMFSREKPTVMIPGVKLPEQSDWPGPTDTEKAHPKPLVSILIPAYNAQEWIADTIRSAINQTWERKEIIVVDDGSTDETFTIAKRFESDGVRTLTQKNQGAAAARNKACSLSKGDYIQWLDADDLLDPEKVTKQMEALSQIPNKRVLLSSSFGRFKYRHHRADFCPTVLWCDLSPVEWLLRKLGQNVYMQTATWLVSRELTESAGPWDTLLLGDDDGEYFCRVLLASEGIRFVPEARVYYRAPWVGTLSYVGRSNRKIEAHWRSMRLHISYLRSLEETERVRVACVKYLQSCFDYFYPERPDIVSQAILLARELGGELIPPRFSWKYSWILAMFGWGPAKRAQTFLPQIKWWCLKSWDKLLFWIRNLFSTESSGTSKRAD